MIPITTIREIFFFFFHLDLPQGYTVAKCHLHVSIFNYFLIHLNFLKLIAQVTSWDYISYPPKKSPTDLYTWPFFAFIKPISLRLPG